MKTGLPPLNVEKRTGSELFRFQSHRLGFDVLSFWQWSNSDLVNNTTRGVLAEYLVARAMGLAKNDVRRAWEAFDLTSPASGIKVEVKSSAFVQSWSQRELSRVVFNVRKTLEWTTETGEFSGELKRHADVYVFALLAHRDKATVDPLDLAQWEFYVLHRTALDSRSRSQHSITLKSLRALCRRPVAYTSLASEIERCAEQG